MKKHLLLLSITTLMLPLCAQEDLLYKKPPQEILELVDFDRPPTISIDSKKENMLLYSQNTYKTLADLAEEEIKIAGLRLNPKTNIASTITYRNNIGFKKLRAQTINQVTGLPKDSKLANFVWSPDETKIAFTHTTATGLQLWYLDIALGKAQKLTDAILNATMGNPITWLKDSKNMLIRTLPKDKPQFINTKTTIPTGPMVSVSTKGEKAQNRTYQDLLSSKDDEINFETLVSSELYKVDLNGNKKLWKSKAIYAQESVSPDGKYILITTIERPYSYIVPYSRFPKTTQILDLEGNLVSNFNKSPLLEVLPQGFMATQTGKRSIGWRNDKPATLTWAEALDEGNPANKVDYRDEVFQLDAPFSGTPASIVKTENRYSSITWGNENTAILYDYWWDTRQIRFFVFDPSQPNKKPLLLSDRNAQDVYSDPGSFDTKRGILGTYVLNLDGDKAYLVGNGHTAKGQFPFVDEIKLTSNTKKRIYESKYTDKKLLISSIIDVKKGEFLVNIQSANEYPNFYIMNTKKRISPMAITDFANPFSKMDGVYKEVVNYKREDGLDLTGTLYLPANYDRESKKEKLPMIIWAYPTEYKDKGSAGQNTTNPNDFIFPYYGSPIYWVMRGYAVLDNAAFPIVGEGTEEPNDTYVKQLVANGKAAIDAIADRGYIDRKRVAIGGHSYGAFMTANLLSHCDLFAAGIARSGAYNRTLTPFGFQAEQRNYWEVPNVYNAMSPFMSADKMKTPLLLIHGGNDNNVGTHTMQSERYFNALKGFGAPARLVVLPNESHGYAAKESILHVLWEQDEWLEKYVKSLVIF